MGIDPDRVIQVSAPKPKNVLWALEEGLGHGALTAVVGVLPENDRAYDFTSSRRLALRAAAHGVTPLLIRDGTQAGMATAAATRWSVAAEPSAPQRRGGPVRPGLGPPRWRVHLSKSKKGLSGQWRLEWDHETLSFRMAAPLADRAPVWPPLLTEQGWATAS
jgi:protein ImuA